MERSRAPGIYRTEENTYEVDSRYKGERIRKRGFESFEQAESYLVAEKQQRRILENGGRPAVTLDQAAAKYIAAELGRDKPSLKTEVYLLKPVVELVGGLMLDMVSNQTLWSFIEARRKDGKKTKTINNSLAVVRRICNLAATDWRHENGLTWLEKAPLISMLDGDDARPPRPMSWDEQRVILPKMPQHLAKMALFDLNTGVRDAVVCNLSWDWEISVPLPSGMKVSVFVVPRQFVKGRKSDRLIVCNSVAQSIIDSQRGLHPERVFTYFKPVKADSGKEPKHVPTSTMNNTAWQRARKAAGMEDLRVHDLRHTVGMRLREAGVADRTQDDILWHGQGKMTGHYAVAQVAELYNALELIKRPSGQESQNIFELVRRRAQVPQKSPAQRKTA